MRVSYVGDRPVANLIFRGACLCRDLTRAFWLAVCTCDLVSNPHGFAHTHTAFLWVVVCSMRRLHIRQFVALISSPNKYYKQHQLKNNYQIIYYRLYDILRKFTVIHDNDKKALEKNVQHLDGSCFDCSKSYNKLICTIWTNHIDR